MGYSLGWYEGPAQFAGIADRLTLKTKCFASHGKAHDHHMAVCDSSVVACMRCDLSWGSVAVADELHMIFECPALQAVRQRYAPLFSTDTNTMRSFFAQQDHMQVFKFVLDCLDVFYI